MKITKRDVQIIVTQMIFVLSLSSYVSLRIYGNTIQAIHEWPIVATITMLVGAAAVFSNLYFFVRRQNKEIRAEELDITHTPPET
jgi:hypothetical protein